MAIVFTPNGNVLNILVTVTAGTPIPLATGCFEIRIEHLFAQMLAGGTARGLLYRGFAPNTAPASIASVAGAPAQLASASTDDPGGGYDFDPGINQMADLRTFAVDGLNSGDQIMIDVRLKV